MIGRAVARIIPWIALAALGCAADGSAARTKSSKALTLTVLVRCDGCGATQLTLVDGRGRRDGWRDNAEVSEIPGCERQTEPGESNADGEAGEGVTILHVQVAKEDAYRLLLGTRDSGEAVISLTGAVDGGKSCAAEGGGPVARGDQSEWRLRWTVKGDSCSATIERTAAASAKSAK